MIGYHSGYPVEIYIPVMALLDLDETVSFTESLSGR
jgi:hypothetical protein